MTTNLLFVCSRNKWRSPTAEAIYRRTSGLRVRSGGVSRRAVHTVSIADLRWADLVILMERKHAQRLRATFPELWRFKQSHVLDIPDAFRFMDPQLVALLKLRVDPILDSLHRSPVDQRRESRLTT